MKTDRIVEAHGKQWLLVQVVATTDVVDHAYALAVELAVVDGQHRAQLPAPVQLIVCEVPK